MGCMEASFSQIETVRFTKPSNTGNATEVGVSEYNLKMGGGKAAQCATSCMTAELQSKVSRAPASLGQLSQLVTLQLSERELHAWDKWGSAPSQFKRD